MLRKDLSCFCFVDNSRELTCKLPGSSVSTYHLTQGVLDTDMGQMQMSPCPSTPTQVLRLKLCQSGLYHWCFYLPGHLPDSPIPVPHVFIRSAVSPDQECRCRAWHKPGDYKDDSPSMLFAPTVELFPLHPTQITSMTTCAG